MEIVILSALVILGVILLLLELLVIPGVGIAGIGGFVLLGLAVWYVYSVFGLLAGHITLACLGVMLIFFLCFALRSKTWKRATLKAEIDGKSDGQPNAPIHVGDRGVTTSRLNPAGKALINNDFFEVRTFDKFVDNGVQVEVVKIENRTIFVQEINDNH